MKKFSTVLLPLFYTHIDVVHAYALLLFSQCELSRIKLLILPTPRTNPIADCYIFYVINHARLKLSY